MCVLSDGTVAWKLNKRPKAREDEYVVTFHLYKIEAIRTEHVSMCVCVGGDCDHNGSSFV